MEKICCPVGFSEELIGAHWSFLNEKGLKLTLKITKSQNFPIFKVFMHFLLKFRQTSWIGMFKRMNKGKGLLFSSLF